jgi:hypothetical protein
MSQIDANYEKRKFCQRTACAVSRYLISKVYLLKTGGRLLQLLHRADTVEETYKLDLKYFTFVESKIFARTGVDLLNFRPGSSYS